EFAERKLRIVQLELAGLEKHAGLEIVLPQARQEEIDMLWRGDHDDAVAAPQARLQVERDGFGEGLRVTVQLREVPVDRRIDQQRTDKWRRHLADFRNGSGHAHAVTYEPP